MQFLLSSMNENAQIKFCSSYDNLLLGHKVGEDCDADLW